MNFQELSELGSEYLEHYGVKGMKWRRHKVTRNSRRVDTLGRDQERIRSEGEWLLNNLKLSKKERNKLKDQIEDYRMSANSVFEQKKNIAKHNPEYQSKSMYDQIVKDGLKVDRDKMIKNHGLKTKKKK